MDEFGRVYSGYPISDGYAIQLTQPDPDAHRPGMVKTHAVVLSGASLACVSVTRVFELLDDIGDPPLTLDELHSERPLSYAPGTGALVDALVARGMVVWTGEGFASALGDAWESLSPDDRRRLTFGAAVHPDAVSVPRSHDGLVVLHTATRYAARWDWPQVDAGMAGPSTAAGHAFLNVDDPAHEVATVLLDRSPRIEQWRHLVAVEERLARFEYLDHENLRALAQLVCLLAPDPTRGQQIKLRVAQRLSEETVTVSFSDLRGMRNVDWHALTGGGSVDALLRAWSASVWGDSLRFPDLSAAVVAIGAEGDRFLEQLRIELREVARSAPGQIAAQVAAAVKDEDGMSVLRWLADTFRPRELDRVLADAVPDRPSKELAELARKKRLAVTHAASINIDDPVNAWRAHLTLPWSAAAAARLAGRMPRAGTVEAALALRDEKLIERAGELVAADPRLLPSDAPHDGAARSVWAAAVRAGADPWAVVDPFDARDALLGELVDGAPIDPGLLHAVADSPAANIFDQPRRAELWQRLPDEVRESFLTATALAAAAAIASAGAIPEPELQASVLSAGTLGQLARKDVRQAIVVLDRLPAAGADNALVVMRAGRFEPVAAEDFGRLVVKRRWNRVARALVDAEAVRPDLRSAAERAQALLSFFERVMRAVGLGESVQTVATPDDLRAALVDMAAELYPRGPAQQSVWERAGGKEGDLPDGQTGRDRWRAALEAVDRKARGAPKQPALLGVMIDDHPQNTQLATLARALDGDHRD